jgi:ethanolamine utilization microcompartment shell protein EutS
LERGKIVSVSLVKEVQPVRAVRIFTAAPDHSAVVVTEYSNTRVHVGYVMRSGGTVVFESSVCDWEAVLRREMSGEFTAGHLISTETLFDVYA